MLLKSIWSFSAFLVVYFKIFRALEQMVPVDAYELSGKVNEKRLYLIY